MVMVFIAGVSPVCERGKPNGDGRGHHSKGDIQNMITIPMVKTFFDNRSLKIVLFSFECRP